MTPARRTAELMAEQSVGITPRSDAGERRAHIMQHPLAQGRFSLALSLAAHRPVTIEAALLVLRHAPPAMTVGEAEAWASRLVMPDSDSLGVSRGH
ncbi:hypothetical protein MU852_07925 [Brevundimonas albigilva]|uniref:Uncharacterized protein n=1 Tax=Brevundimonas albigilva TaxID=1312364 RepID=A0ABY4SRL8_9CAUL|nr:hypothetical protein [Brevundimonas albigilva]UQV19648.1 hypothetical protein MU852_07925 [Brevundimonas albigilva]URI15325.1 hypothetical protein M8231_16295 [Brevundimonas albigilva]